VLAFIDPVLVMKTSIFVETSLKRLISFQILLRDISLYWKRSDLDGSFFVKALWPGIFLMFSKTMFGAA
jgi:hypothetical protein